MISKVYIRVALRDGISFLRESYFTPPFKVADITEDRKGGILQLMLMCSSPGILDEDAYEIRVEMDEGTSLRLHTQSYQRLFDMKKGASQSMEVRIGKGASFCYLPHPSVPHANSIYTGKNRICLSEGSSLVWGEVLTCGRKLSGEQFLFSRYQTLTEVFIKDRLVVRENICLQPSEGDVGEIHAIGLMEGFTHQASLLVLRDGAGLQEMIGSLLSGEKDIQYGISALPVNGWIVRMLGCRAEQLHDCLKRIASIYFYAENLAGISL